MSTSSLKSTANNQDVTAPAVVAMHWFRKGLRLHDNPALLHALSLVNESDNGTTSSNTIYPVFIIDPNSYQLLKCSVMRANFLLQCLQDLDASLRQCGSRLYVTTGDPVEVLPQLWNEFGITHMTHEADETGEPYAVERDGQVAKAANELGVHVKEFAGMETLRPLGNVTGGYVKNVGGFANAVPGTMTSFQNLIARMDGGSVPLPLDAPTKDDFPNQNDDVYEKKYLPLKHAWEIPWPRGYERSEIGPVWNRKDCKDKSLSPIAKGGESMALERLQKSVSERPDW